MRIAWKVLFVLLSGCACPTTGVPQYDGGLPHGDLRGREHIDSFVFLGDTQETSRLEFWRERNAGVQSEIFKHVAADGPAFVLHLGDLVFQGASACHWARFDDYVRPLQEGKIPILPLPGNHEYFGHNDHALEHYFRRFPHVKDRLWSTFRFRSVGIILLNSNFNRMSEEMRDYQFHWYCHKLRKFQEDEEINLIVVASHHPPFTNSIVVCDDERVKWSFVEPFLETSKARLFLSGHSHSYEHFVDEGKHFIASGGGGGPRHPLLQDERHHDEYRKQLRGKRDFNYSRVILSSPYTLEMIRLSEGFEPSIGESFVIDSETAKSPPSARE